MNISIPLTPLLQLKYLKDSYGIVPPFNLLINGMHMIGAMKKGVILKNGDDIKLIPFLSGG